MTEVLDLSGEWIGIDDVLRTATARGGVRITVGGRRMARVEASRATLDKVLASGRVVYGVNTGVGGFVNRLIPDRDRSALQRNLLSGVATNVGPSLAPEVVRSVMLARLVSLAQGNSAIRPGNLDKYRAFIESGLIPRVPEWGSLGASGDLGPLAHIALVMTGRGSLLSGERDSDITAVLASAGLQPMDLDYKEGLSLVNGTSAMVGYGIILLGRFSRILRNYHRVSALSFEAMSVRAKPFDPLVHAVKPHPEQLAVSRDIFNILRDSNLVTHEDHLAVTLDRLRQGGATHDITPIEDAYSIRCTPQILGPVWHAINDAADVVERELNSSNDNPLALPGDEDVFHNGHFHGQYVAMAMDQLAAAAVTVANLSDRRTDRLLDAKKNGVLPPFLAADPGVTLGLMGVQFLITSITAEMRSMVMPLATQTLPSTGDFQDHVSLGFVGCRRLSAILDKLEYVIACEYLCGAVAVALRERHDDLSGSSRELVKPLTPHIAALDGLTDLSALIEFAAGVLRRGLTPAIRLECEPVGAFR